MNPRARKEEGFTLVQVILTLGVLAVVTLGLATGVGTGHQAAKKLEQQSLLLARGQEYLERLLAIPFGRSDSGPALPAALTELLDNDNVLGSATLHGVRAAGALEFEPAGFPVAGRWRIEVDQDLNGDGDTEDPEEDRSDLLRIAIFHEGRLVARTIRFDPVG